MYFLKIFLCFYNTVSIRNQSIELLQRYVSKEQMRERNKNNEVTKLFYEFMSTVINTCTKSATTRTAKDSEINVYTV